MRRVIKKTNYLDKYRKIISFLLIALLLFSSITKLELRYVEAKELTDYENNFNNVSVSTRDNSDVEISYHVNSSWGEHYNVDVILTNITDEKIDDWEIRLPADFSIENIWNARIMSSEKGSYTIHNADWNQDIPVDGKVSFGMTIKSPQKPDFPKYCNTTRICLGVMTEYKVEYTEYSSWNNYINGKITITNCGNNRIEDWKLMLETNFNIESIWNATILTQEEKEGICYYDIDNVVNNQNLEPKQCIEFGFIAKCDEKPKIIQSDLFEMKEFTDEIRESCMDADLDDVEDYENDECIFDADYFKTSQEYENYINGLMGKTRKLTRQRTTNDNLNRAITNPISGVLIKSFDFSSSEKAIQNYMPLADGIYTLQHRSNDEESKEYNDAILMSGSLCGNKYHNFSEKTNLVGFAHGQTFEQFSCNGVGYYLLAGNAKNGFARNLVIMKEKKFEQISHKQTYDIKDWEKNKKSFLVLTDLEYANKKSKKSGPGKMHRVDAALTADGKTMVIWKKLTKPSVVEISLYDMDKIQKKILKNKFEKALSFKDKNTRWELKKACIGSFYEQYKVGDDTSKHILQANDSFQSIDIENAGKNAWKILITSGNQKVKKPVSITRIDFKKNGTKKCYREYISFPGIEENKFNFELEGGHIVGDNLDFVVKMAKKAGSGKEQYIATIPLKDIKTPLK